MDPTLLSLLLAAALAHPTSVGIVFGGGRPACTFMEDGTGRYRPRPPVPCDAQRLAYLQAHLPPIWCRGIIWAPGTGGPPACERKPVAKVEP